MSIKYLTLALCMAMLATSIQAETINCTPITSVPVTITAQGIYCLTGKLGTNQTSGTAITINANNVTIDLNGWKVDDGAAGTGTQAYGIYSAANNVTIKNGIVRGFYWAFYLTGSGAIVQDMLIDSNTYVGIDVSGPGALIEHNQVVNTGGNTSPGGAYGIVINGDGSTISDNIVSGLTNGSGGNEYGIYLNNTTSIARNNVVSNTSIPSGWTSFGFVNSGIALNNTASKFTYGIQSYSGSIYAYNTVTYCTTDYTGGTTGAGNSGT